jgi:serine/threonine-protein kinase SRPK3
LDHFEHTGPNGVHLCFVMEYMWHSLNAMRDPYKEDAETRLLLAKHISKQLIKGMRFLQSCGLMHNGISSLCCFNPRSSS